MHRALPCVMVIPPLRGLLLGYSIYGKPEDKLDDSTRKNNDY